MSSKYPRNNRPLTISIKGRLDEMPPEHVGVMEINGKHYRVRRVMGRYTRNASTGWKEYTLEAKEDEENNVHNDRD